MESLSHTGNQRRQVEIGSEVSCAQHEQFTIVQEQQTVKRRDATVYTLGVLEQDSTKRFSSRVRDYQRFRPGYPAAVIELLRHECDLAQNTVVADIASGTGIFSRLLLEAGARVIGVEPNAEMRNAGDDFLAEYSHFESAQGTAEATGLPPQSVDLITAAQAAHWFDLERARGEFLRILKPGGWLVLIWNDRRQTTPFAREYESLLVEFGTDYLEVRRLDENRNVGPLFGSSSFRKKVFPNSQDFDYAGLEGRLLSSSYVPRIVNPHHEPMLQKLHSLFERHQESGHVIFEYDTQVFYGQLS